MKKSTRLIFTTAFLTLAAFAAITYTSCKKDPCAGVTCQNGGSCSGGSCICPTGYTGSNCETAATTTLQFTNKAFTPIAMTVNGVASIIAVGSSISYNGSYGTSLSYTAYTYETTTTGSQVGQRVNWGDTHTFPSSGIDAIDLNVSSSMFFLKISNTNSSYYGQGVYVNYNATAQTFDNVSIPNNGVVYNIGYYAAYTNTELYILSNPSGDYWDYYPTFSFLPNQAFTFDIE